ncbi:MAG: hypothetical protein U9R26_08990, partial [Campylobacterota bacterium]|nr:hypothetical protein [Campylobacterota bacterium]
LGKRVFAKKIFIHNPILLSALSSFVFPMIVFIWLFLVSIKSLHPNSLKHRINRVSINNQVVA